MFNRLELIEARYFQIQELLLDPDITKDIKKYTALIKEAKSLEEIVTTYQKYKKNNITIEELKELTKEKDLELANVAKLELEEAFLLEEQLNEKLKILLIPKDENDEKNVIVEIRGAAGGDEANLFAADLFRMYTKYAESRGWKIEVTYADETGLGGFSSIEFIVSGEAVYSLLKYESGSHRVQRVPTTEASGRIHTSTATVLVMPEADEVDVQIDLNDVRIDTFCSSGHGGQSVNTTYSAVRVTHLPTGIAVQCQDGKSQHENKANALKVLHTRLYDKILNEQKEKTDQERLSKVGSGDRSEKIRTYNYPQNRVTDHRIGFTIQQLDRVMEGRLDPIIEALIQEDQRRILAGKKPN